MAMSRIVTCFVCDKEEVTNRAFLPDNWIQEWDTSKIVCDNCTADFAKRFGQQLQYLFKGGEKLVW